MSSELEPRLKRALSDLPGPTRAARERARTAALAVIPARPRSHGRRRVVVVAVAAAVVAALAAAALAATGRIHVQLGASHPSPPIAPTHLVLPRGTHGVALVAGGRLWVAARGGARIEGWRATAAALSPGARYVAVGMGRSLIAMAPSGRPAWSHRTAGRVVAAAWRPDGLEIAYVVARRGRYDLRMIQGDGDHDHAVARYVAPVTPSWRGDSLGLAWVRAGGRVVVRDYARGSLRVLVGSPECRPVGVRAVAFAPRGGALAMISRTAVFVAHAPGRMSCLGFAGAVLALDSVSWIRGGGLVTAERSTVGAQSYLRRYAFGAGNLREVGSAGALSQLLATATPPIGRPVAVAQIAHGRLQLGVVAPPSMSHAQRLRPQQLLLGVRGTAAVSSLSWR